MAISNLVKGNGFKGALAYIMEKAEASHIAQSGVFGRTPQEIALEMRMNANQREITDPVLHASLSLEPGEQATPEQLKILGETWLREMGFDLDKTQYTITRHSDRDHDHIHILANRMQLDGKMLSTSNDFRRSHEATRVAEQAAGLRLFQDREKSQSKGRGKLHDLRQAVAQAVTAAAGDVDRFKKALAEHGIRLVEHRQSTGRLQGVSYEGADGRMFKGSALGKECSAGGLKRAGLDIAASGLRPDQRSERQPPTGKQDAAHESGQAARSDRPGADHAAAAVQAVGGASKTEVRNLLHGRESLGLSQGQKDRLKKNRSRSLDLEM